MLPISNWLMVGCRWGTLPISNWLLIDVAVEEGILPISIWLLVVGGMGESTLPVFNCVNVLLPYTSYS